MKGLIIILFIPWLAASYFSYDPVISYLIAWAGSFYIFYVTISGKIVPIPDDRAIAAQLMRPLFLMQLIFAGYMSCTSIFFFADMLGYVNFVKVNDYFLVNQHNLELTAQAQRYYCLGHAASASGILVFMKYPVKKMYAVKEEIIPALLLKSAIISFVLSYVFDRLPGLGQFSYQLGSLSFMAGTLALAFSIPQKNPRNVIISLILYFFNLYQALISGYKEPIIISILVLGVFLYPIYKKAVILFFIPLLISMFIILPAYNKIFRASVGVNVTGNKQLAEAALKGALGKSSGSSADNSNWNFFANRLSEIGMFNQFLESTPQRIDFYGLTLLKQSAMALVPRIFWPSKPITEELIMERVYRADVVSRASDVSAKPTFVVDSYLSAGTLGVLIFMFAYGAIAQLIALKAEQLFGGYTLGTALIFSGLFQIFWRGLSFEFLINTVFWSYITMLIIAKIFRMANILNRI